MPQRISITAIITNNKSDLELTGVQTWTYKHTYIKTYSKRDSAKYYAEQDD